MVRLAALLVVVALVAAACGGDSMPSSSACTMPTAEPLDPASGLHVLDPTSVTFDDLTPTSGPHTTAGGPLGVAETTLPPAQQVAILERGSVLISVDAAETTLLDEAAELFAEETVVQPVGGLDDPIVVTAWRTRITCSSMDADFIGWFVDDRTGQFAAEEH